jgi:hypothetical protein
LPFPMLVIGGSVMLGSYLWMLLFVMGQKTFYLNLLGGFKRTSSNNLDETGRVAVDTYVSSGK